MERTITEFKLSILADGDDRINISNAYFENVFTSRGTCEKTLRAGLYEVVCTHWSSELGDCRWEELIDLTKDDKTVDFHEHKSRWIEKKEREAKMTKAELSALYPGMAKSTERYDIPDGTYRATWSGWSIKVHLEDGSDFPEGVKANSGIRGIFECTVTVEDGWVYPNKK